MWATYPSLRPGPADTFMSYDLPWANASNTPFRLFKRWIHEGGISTPFIMHWPGRIKQSGIVNSPAYISDITATCIAAAGAIYPTENNGNSITPLEGESFLSVVEGQRWNREAPIFWEHEGNRAVRVGEWKLVAEHDGPWELYNMDEDRTELNDLAAGDANRVRQMAALWQGWADRANVVQWPANPAVPRIQDDGQERTRRGSAVDADAVGWHRYGDAHVQVVEMESIGMSEQSARHPNIIICLVDDLGFSDLGSYGSRLLTSNIDSLAENGIRCTQMYNSARCCPSRAALLTGLYPHQAGVGHMTADYGIDSYQGYLNDRCVTVAEVLRTAGYRTLMSGKWHVGGNYHPPAPEFGWPSGEEGYPTPRQRGFDRFFGIWGGYTSFFNPDSLGLDDTPIEAETTDFYLTEEITNHALRMIDEGSDSHKPVFPLPVLYRPSLAPACTGRGHRQVRGRIPRRLGRGAHGTARVADRYGAAG